MGQPRALATRARVLVLGFAAQLDPNERPGMKIFEYQAKALFRRFGIPVLKGGVARNPNEAESACAELPEGVIVVKSQCHLGGRGKGRFVEHGDDGPGGVVVAKTRTQVKELATKMLGSTLVTKQGREKVEIIFLEAGCAIERELYAAIVLDRSIGKPIIMASTEGGMDIEEVAEKTPEKILKEVIDPLAGLQDFQARRLAYALGMKGETAKQGAALLKNLARLSLELDTSLAEVNPLVVTKSGDVVALDAKMAFDENALYRHGELVEKYGSEGGLDPAEVEAAEKGLSYVKLDGNIGCLVNGAGLAMATMDIIKYEGGNPANFLDVGGGANEERVTAAFRIILRDPNVEAILVNIFGGIVHCDMIAKGVLAAVKNVGLQVPLVVRLEGTNAEKGREILDQSQLAVISATSMADAAKKVVTAAKDAKKSDAKKTGGKK
jgi:succinyl-CoA synthetase beta subunit